MVKDWLGSFRRFDIQLQKTFQKIINWLCEKNENFKKVQISFPGVFYLLSVIFAGVLSIRIKHLLLVSAKSTLFSLLPLFIIGAVCVFSYGMNAIRFMEFLSEENNKKVDKFNDDIRRTGAIFFVVPLLVLPFANRGWWILLMAAGSSLLCLVGSYFSVCKRTMLVIPKENGIIYGEIKI